VSAPSWPNRDGFLNAPTNPFTATTRLGARDYNPSLGRFLSVDPVLDTDVPQQSVGYAYALNNPLTLSDPSGRDPAGPCSVFDTRRCGTGSSGSCQTDAQCDRNTGHEGDGSYGGGSGAYGGPQASPAPAPAHQPSKAKPKPKAGCGFAGLSCARRVVKSAAKSVAKHVNVSVSVCIGGCLSASWQDTHITAGVGGVGFGGWAGTAAVTSAGANSQSQWTGAICAAAGYGGCVLAGLRGRVGSHQYWFGGGPTYGAGVFVGGYWTFFDEDMTHLGNPFHGPR
jgi:RHS repeat-associated protein